ncbi:MAG: alpha/beta hydrolase [Candidatus Nomurabacteria bacterium]|jgi:pimeloyl-ACP methyl ester carboxylesterase|nr:alpha/beta hydrolase [Candidatus Nomurabacteria bacterium]
MTNFEGFFEKVAKLPNSTVHYWQNDFDAARPTVLMVHGYRGEHHGMLLIADQLKLYFNIIIPDLPGFGKSSEFHGGPHGLDNYSDFLKTFIVHLKLPKKPMIIGHSFGTIVSSKFEMDYPQLTDKKLVLLSPIASRPLKKRTRRIANFFANKFLKVPDSWADKITRSNLVSDVISKKMTKTKNRHVRKMIKAEHRKYFSTFSSNKVMVESGMASYTFSVGEFAEYVNKKVLLIAGENDELARLDKVEALLKKFPHRPKLIIKKHAGHLIHYECPDSVAKDIRDFLL